MKYKLFIFLLTAFFALTFQENVSAQKSAANSAIKGKLLQSNGQPLAYTEIELVPVGSNVQVNDARLLATSSTSGLFTFQNVPDGNYTLSINFDEKPTNLSPYSTFFYPNTANRAEAEVFRIDATSNLNNLVFRLPPRLVQRKIIGKVLWSDGKPVADAYVFLRDVEFDMSLTFGEIKTDNNGNFTTVGFEGRKYQVGAVLFDKAGKSLAEFSASVIASANSDVFVLNAGTANVKLTVELPKEIERMRDKQIGALILH